MPPEVKRICLIPQTVNAFKYYVERMKKGPVKTVFTMAPKRLIGRKFPPDAPPGTIAIVVNFDDSGAYIVEHEETKGEERT